jgi:hypothetical protein
VFRISVVPPESNRSAKNVKMLYVLVDGDFTPALEGQFPRA